MSKSVSAARAAKDSSALDSFSAREAFIELQEKQLQHHGVKARSKFVKLAEPAMEVHVLIAGQGRPLIFFHGGDGEAVTWAPLMAQLQNDFQVIGVDRPGFGLTGPFDYRTVDLRRHASDFTASLMDALGLESAILMGGSMGGFFTLSAALDHPGRVDKVILVGMAVGLTNVVSKELIQICTMPGAAHHFMQRVASLEGQRWQYQSMFHIDPDIVPEIHFQNRLAGLALPGVPDTWATLLSRLCDANGFRPEIYLGPDLPRLKQPVLLLWGARDMAPTEVGREAAKSIPHCAFIEMEGVGHYPFLEAPEATADWIKAFLHQAGPAS